MFLVPTMLYFWGWQAQVVSALRGNTVDLPAPEPNLAYVCIAVALSIAVAGAAYWLGHKGGDPSSTPKQVKAGDTKSTD